MRILVTGGAGYIGSHTCVELLNAGYELVVVDNLCNSQEEALRRVERITGKKIHFHRVDLLDKAGLYAVFAHELLDAVIHFAGLKSVGESVEQPLRYYQNNLTGTLNLCELMASHNIKKLVFSSSATVYGENTRMPLKEDAPLQATNPYGRSKLFIEEMLQDLAISDPSWSIILLRYFNPVGAHPSGLIGEDPSGVPNNLFPYITQVAVGRLPELRIFGNDYPTPDGTGVRDYIHVVDLATGHIAALQHLERMTGARAYNLGTGNGSSVLEVVQAFERASGREIPYRFEDRRPGDVPVSYADPSQAERELGWKAERDINQMCADAWRWQSQNPEGY